MNRRVTATGPAYVGVDLLLIDELDRLMSRRWFRHLLYSEPERLQAAALGPSRRREFLAGRFAGKEAVLKGLRTGMFAGIPPWQIDIGRAENSAPEVRLSGAAARRAAEVHLARIELSISHKRNLVIAMAVGAPAASPEHPETAAWPDPGRVLDAAVAQTAEAHSSLLMKGRGIGA